MHLLVLLPAVLWLASQAWIEAGPMQAISGAVALVVGALAGEWMER